ncbi:MAG: Na/Pi cotransporter family protein [Clostridia bacterium]
MGITDFLALLGGLALFLYGMQMMSSGLEAAAGNRMSGILEKLTGNRFMGVLVGAGITAVIQSSSATTVMVVGFVNSGMMKLQQAVWVIMGANIGTTVTGQLIALDVGAMAPLIAFIGVALIVFTKRQNLHHWGQIISGLGILFIGMEMMSGAMMPLRDSPAFIGLMTGFSNPLFGIMAGMIFTALIQSSSASVGILQALAMSGLIGLPGAVYVLFGQNIGTCITAVLASIGANRNAKRTTIIHLMFNVIGTVLFTLVCYFTPLVTWVESLTPDNVASQIANMHTLFNIVTTLLLLPFGTYMAKAACRILPETEQEKDSGFHLKFVKSFDLSPEASIGTSAIIASEVTRELRRMSDMVQENVSGCFGAVLDGKTDRMEEITLREEYIDFLNKEIQQYISRSVVFEQNTQNAALSTSLFHICGNLERIGDHAVNIAGYARRLKENRVDLSDMAKGEIREMRTLCDEALSEMKNSEKTPEERLALISGFEQRMDDMTEQFRENQILRMGQGICSGEACVLYSELLTDFERIGDHILNIGYDISRSNIRD